MADKATILFVDNDYRLNNANRIRDGELRLDLLMNFTELSNLLAVTSFIIMAVLNERGGLLRSCFLF